MSALQHTDTGLPARKVKLLTRKEQRYLAARLRGDSMQDAAKEAGLPPWLARTRSLPEVEALVEEASIALNEIRFEQCLVDAVELHEQLTDELRGDLADLYTEEGELKPVRDWPLWARQGGVEVLDEPNMVHSADDGGGSWDQVGRRIKIRAVSRAKTRELAMKHKGVDAMVQQKAGDVNVLVVSAEKAREVMSAARQRLLKATVTSDAVVSTQDSENNVV